MTDFCLTKSKTFCFYLSTMLHVFSGSLIICKRSLFRSECSRSLLIFGTLILRTFFYYWTIKRLFILNCIMALLQDFTLTLHYLLKVFEVQFVKERLGRITSTLPGRVWYKGSVGPLWRASLNSTQHSFKWLFNCSTKK